MHLHISKADLQFFFLNLKYVFLVFWDANLLIKFLHSSSLNMIYNRKYLQINETWFIIEKYNLTKIKVNV